MKVTQKSVEQKKKIQSSAIYTPIKYNFVIKGIGGIIAESNSKFSGFYSIDNNYYYGFGFAGEYHSDGKHAFGINYDRLYKKFPLNYLQVKVYTISWMYKFKTRRTSLPIGIVHLGIAKPDRKNSLTAKTVKLGFGFLGHTTSSINFKITLNYQLFFSSDQINSLIGEDYLGLISLDIALGIPL